ncbi:MAG: hypothetical protein MPW15_19620 [Candidatus Manganitrophus sp.]|nr:hypothetical protein [Candidatus Manganitrophus sp.]
MMPQRRRADSHSAHRPGHPRDSPETESADDKRQKQSEKAKSQQLFLDCYFELHYKTFFNVLFVTL